MVVATGCERMRVRSAFVTRTARCGIKPGAHHMTASALNRS